MSTMSTKELDSDITTSNISRENLKERLKLKLSQCPELGLEELPSAEERLTKFIKENKKTLPVFYTKIPTKDEQMKAKIIEDARENLLVRKNLLLFDHDELTKLYKTLEINSSPPFGDEKLIGYSDFKNVLHSMDNKEKMPVTAKVFLKLLTDDPYGRVPVNTLFNYIMRKTWLKQTRIGISMYDETGRGFIKEAGLENYITELIPTLAQLNGIESSFLPFYICTALRKFFFFLDPNRTNQIRIIDILSSGFIDDLLDLREEGPPKESNWFSIQSTMKAYGQYLNLDKNHNGMLDKKELLSYGGPVSLTETFVDRVFAECQTFEGEMDYRTYLDFILAMENRKEPQSLKYFFRLLDINHEGYIDAFTLHYFFKDIQKCVIKEGADNIHFEDVKDEIFDMVKPKNPSKITLQDLINSGCGDTVIFLLIDINGFWSYENREVSGSQSTQEFRSSEV